MTFHVVTLIVVPPLTFALLAGRTYLALEADSWGSVLTASAATVLIVAGVFLPGAVGLALGAGGLAVTAVGLVLAIREARAAKANYQRTHAALIQAQAELAATLEVEANLERFRRMAGLN